MGIKDLLVHVNVSKHCRKRLEIAAHLAKSFDARLTGLFTSATHDVPFFMMEEVVSKIEPTMRGWWLATRDRVKSEFDAFLRETGVAADWVEAEDEVASTVPYHARYADLTIVGQTDPEELLPRPEYDIAESVALGSGRPVLVVPYAGSFPTLGQRVLVAWNGSPQSARAVNDAVPFLRRAAKVTILTVNPQGLHNSRNDRPGARITAHLAQHGVKAEPRELTVGDVDIDQMILSQVSDLGADLVVMGAYGHPRSREMVLGGATRAVFRYMTVPVLMSH